MEVLMCLGFVLVCLTLVGSRLAWALGEATTPVEKQFGPHPRCTEISVQRQILLPAV